MAVSREEHVFVVRIWKEAAATLAGWRATVVHLPSGSNVAASDLRDINDFIQLRLAPTGAPLDGSP